MLDFNSIVGDVVSEGCGRDGTVRTASRNHYDWEISAGLRVGMRVRLLDGREGTLTAPFPGCRGDGDWCGIFLDDGSEANVRPRGVASVFDKSAGWSPVAGELAAEGKTVSYTVEFKGHGTDRMAVSVRKVEGIDGEEITKSRNHEQAADLLASLVEFEANARPDVARPAEPEGVLTGLL